jgi:hypothetical protein
VTCLLKDRIFEREDMAVARERPVNMLPWQGNTNAKLKELLRAEFSFPSVPRLYKEESREMSPASRRRR